MGSQVNRASDAPDFAADGTKTKLYPALKLMLCGLYERGYLIRHWGAGLYAELDYSAVTASLQFDRHIV